MYALEHISGRKRLLVIEPVLCSGTGEEGMSLFKFKCEAGFG